MSIYTFDSLPTGQLQRFPCGISHIDWLLGSKHDGYGFARGGLSLWGGSAGVGKTRAMVSICERMTDIGVRVLWFQLEQQLSLFKGKYLMGQRLGPNFLFSDESDGNKMIEIIKKVKPDFVVVDSVNKIDQFRNSDSAIKKIEKAFRAAVTSLAKPAHLAFITHLNAKGAIKGGTMLPHMVDTVLHIDWVLEPLFQISIPEKNRFGKSGSSMWVGCNHRADGVIFENNGGQTRDRVLMKDALVEVPRPAWHYLMIPFAVAMCIFGLLVFYLMAFIGQPESAAGIANFKMWWGVFCLDGASWRLGLGFGVKEEEDTW